MTKPGPKGSSRRKPAKRDAVPIESPTQLAQGDLVDRVSALVEHARESIAAQANATLYADVLARGPLDRH